MTNASPEVEAANALFRLSRRARANAQAEDTRNQTRGVNTLGVDENLDILTKVLREYTGLPAVPPPQMNVNWTTT